MGGQFIVGPLLRAYGIMANVANNSIICNYVHACTYMYMHVLTLCLVASQIDGVSIGLGTFTIPVDVVVDCLVCVLVALPG